MSPQEQAGYRADGFLVRRSVFARTELPALREAVEHAAERAAGLAADGREYVLDGKRFVDVDEMTIQFEHEPGSRLIRVIEPVHQLSEVLTELTADGRLVEPMRDLVGSEHVALWTDKLNLKRPREGSAFGWHQDSPYWIHDCGHVDRLPNVMVLLDDACEANGCFRVIRGSHTAGCLPGRNDGSALGGFFTSPDAFDSAREVAIEAPAGSLVFFSPHSVHGSYPNRSDSPRRALVLTYQPAGFPMLKSGCVRNVG